MADVDERIILEFTIDSQRALKASREFRMEVDKAKEELKKLKAQTKDSYDAVAKSMMEAKRNSIELANANATSSEKMIDVGEAMRHFGQQTSQALREVKDEQENVSKGASVFQKAWLVAIAAVIAVTKELFDWFKQLAIGGAEVAQSIFRLGASVRALQRVGIDITMSEVVDQIRELRQEFSFFTTKEVADGISQVQLLTRSFGFTTEQMKEMMRVSTALAVIQGKDVGETAKELALFYSSGYAEALQRAGFAVNKLSIEEQARADGINKSFRELTEAERATAAHNLVMKQAAPLLAEVTEYEKSLAGQIEATTANIEEQENILSQQLLPVYKKWMDSKLTAIKLLSLLLFAVAEVNKEMGFAKLSALNIGAAIGSSWKEALKEAGDENLTFVERLDLVLEKMGAVLDLSSAGKDVPIAKPQQAPPILTENIEDFVDEVRKLQDQLAEDLAQAQKELWEDVGSLDDRALARREMIFSQFNNIAATQGVEAAESFLEQNKEIIEELGEIDEAGLDKVLDIWIKFYDKLDDIARKAAEKVADAQIDLQQDLQDLAIDTQRKIEDAQRKFREGELRAEREYQEKLRRLQEEFLFDLEDALRERDAKQVLRLIRRFRLDMAQLERQGEEERQERLSRYQEEIDDIRRQAARKEEELHREYARRLEDIERQSQREREAANRERERALEELKEDLEKQREERVDAYEKEVDDIKTTFQDKLTEIVETVYKDFQGSTEEFTKMVTKVLQAAFGEDGVAANSFDNFNMIISNAVGNAIANISLLRNLAEEAAQTAQAIASLTTPGYGVGAPGQEQWETPNYGGEYAQGGMMVANKPTLALFGEAGPEMATFIPLSKLGKVGGSNNVPVSQDVNAGGMMRLEVGLSPDLVVRVIDSTLGETAQLIEERLR